MIKERAQRAMYAGFNSEIWLKLQKHWLPQETETDSKQHKHT